MYAKTGNSEDIKEITNLVSNYCLAVKTQNENDFKNVFGQEEQCSLISVDKLFQGLKTIYEEFLLNLIQKTFTKIELIKDEELKINFINEKTAIVIFNYHTECILRESGKPFGIKRVETQVSIKEKGNWKIVHIHYSKS